MVPKHRYERYQRSDIIIHFHQFSISTRYETSLRNNIQNSQIQNNFFQSIDRGDGIKAEALPGSTYWTSQLGASEAMVQQQIDDIKAHKADFIVTETRDSLSLEQQINILNSYGYKVAYKFKSDESWTFKRALLIVDTRQ